MSAMRKLASVGGLLAALLLLISGCMPEPAYTPTPTKTPDPALELTVAAEAATAIPATSTPYPPTDIPTLTPTPTATPTLTSGELATDEHYWLSRPIPPEGLRTYIDRTYPYGSTAEGKYRPHTGVEFFNPEGTPVAAAADGVVYAAGTDQETVYGPHTGFYGNLIIVEHSGLSYGGQTVYTVYGHLSAIEVKAGDAVTDGQVIGRVGGTGIANGGSHLHFEVRLGDPLDYFGATRNPDLWITPYPGYGTLAGRISGPDGKPIREASLTVQNTDRVFYIKTYAGDENVADVGLGENFTYGDVPAGTYNVAVVNEITGKVYREQVEIVEGHTTWVAFQFER